MKKKFVYVEKPESDFTSIKLIDGPYNELIYTYGKVTVSESNGESETASLTFDYYVEEIPPIIEKTRKELESDEDFVNYIGDVLVQILEDSIEYERSSKDNSPEHNSE